MKYVFIVFLFILLGCNNKVHSTRSHVCTLKECPYKGIPTDNYKPYVLKYSGCDDGTDCFAIDCLHILHPTLSYGELEEMLFTD